MTTLPQDQVNGAFAHGAPVLASPVHGGKIPVHGGVVKPQHGIEYIVNNDPSAGYALYLPFSAAVPTYRVGAMSSTGPIRRNVSSVPAPVAATETANSIANPVDGAVNASLFTEDTANTQHIARTSVEGGHSAQLCTSSVYVKAANGATGVLFGGNDGGTFSTAKIDLTTGVATFNSGNNLVSGITTTSLPNGWWRISYIGRLLGGSIDCYIDDGSGSVVRVGNGVRGLYVYGALVEAGASLQTFFTNLTNTGGPAGLPGYADTRSGIKGETTPVPGIQYVSPNVPAIIPGVGYWSRVALTNLVLRSQEFENATWAGANYTTTANSLAAPDGTPTADTFIEDAASTFKYAGQAITTVAASVYTASVFAKAGTNNKIQFIGGGTGSDYCNFDLAGGTVGSSSGCTGYIVACANGWYRCIVVGTAAGASSTVAIAHINALTDVRTPVYLGTSRTVYVWQAQSILGNHPAGGPIIATAGATAGTSADVFTETVAKPLASFVIYGKAVLGAGKAADAYLFDWTDGTANNRIAAKINSSNQVAFAVVNATVNTPITGEGGTPATSRTVTWALRFNGSTWRGFAQGAALGAESAAAAIPAGTTFNDAHSLGANQLDDVTTGIRVIEGAQNDAAVIALMAAL